MGARHDPMNRRAAAFAAGENVYDTGLPCVNGHTCLRYTATKLCVQCKQETFKKQYAKDKTRWLGYANNWRNRNRDAVNNYAKEYRKNNPEKFLESQKKFVLKNAARRSENERARQARKTQAMPVWLTKEHLSSIRSIYKQAADWSKKLGKKMHVDHIVPIKGKQVCGLHVPWNLQILAQSENCVKHARLTEEAYCPMFTGFMYGKGALPWNGEKHANNLAN